MVCNSEKKLFSEKTFIKQLLPMNFHLVDLVTYVVIVNFATDNP